MKIIVLGGEGMLGHKMFQILSGRFPKTKCTVIGSFEDSFYRTIPLFTAATMLEKINALDFLSMQSLLNNEKPEYIINCIGIVKQRDEARMAIPSITINALLPHMLAEWASKWGGRLIHFSTDCVFSGQKGCYNEEDPSDAIDLYGKTKYLGEVSAVNALTLRTSIIGREITQFRSLLEWLLAQKGRKVKGFRRVIYSGVTTNYIAELVAKILIDYPKLCGLFHITAPVITKYDLLCRLRDAYGLDVEIVPDENEVSDRSMNGALFRKVTAYPEPSWDELVAKLVTDPTPYDEWKKEIARVQK